MLLTHRKLLQSEAIAIDNDLRGRNLGLKVGWSDTVKFAASIKELVKMSEPRRYRDTFLAGFILPRI
jgi:hypothetical protein